MITHEVAVLEGGAPITIGECCLDTDTDIVLERALSDLDDDERARAARFVFARDRDRFVRAHGYLRRRLGAVLGVAPRDVPLVAVDGEKPFVRGSAVSFNLSHSGSLGVVAITEGREIGIDLEVVDTGDGLDDQLDDLARTCMTGEECAALADLQPEQRVRRFLSYWTAKEARMKLTGEGMALEPRTIALKLDDGRPVGYQRPRGLRASLRFIPLSRPEAICCVAIQHAAGRATSHRAAE